MLLYAALLLFAGVIRVIPRRRPARHVPLDVLIIGRMFNPNWSQAHLEPLVRAGNVGCVVAVMDGPVSSHAKLTIAKPPPWMSRLMGRHLPRLLMACWIALRTRPDVIMGYSLMPSALLALVLGRCLSAACVYQMTGGLLEITGAGGLGQDRSWCAVPAFGKRMLSALAVRAAGRLDAIIVRGQRAKRYMADRTQVKQIQVICGSVDDNRFKSEACERTFDVAYVGRMTAIKQPDHALEVIGRVIQGRPCTRAAMVGGGDMLEQIVARAKERGWGGHIEFPGHLKNVEDVLTRSRVFVLTSRSEGLSIALAEAMTAGAVPVVYDVGDLGELVKDGETGWLIRPGDFETHARRVIELLDNPDLWRKFSKHACAFAMANNGVQEVANRWTACFESLRVASLPGALSRPQSQAAAAPQAKPQAPVQ